MQPLELAPGLGAGNCPKPVATMGQGQRTQLTCTEGRSWVHMELHRSLGVAMNMTGRRERAATNLFLISVQSASEEDGQMVEMLCPSTALQPPYPCIAAQKRAVQQALISPSPLIPQATSNQTSITSGLLCSQASLSIHLWQVLETGCRARWIFDLNPLRWAQTWQTLGLMQAGNSHFKLMTEFVPKEFSTYFPTTTPQGGGGGGKAFWPKPIPI